MLKNKRTRDGHMHSSYCPHGTPDKMELYVEKAIKLGLKEISFTEHMPLPDTLLPFNLPKDSCLTTDQVKPYLAEVEMLQKKFKKQIKINRGLEVDYIEGQEAETKTLLNLYGKSLDDGILSVHILKIAGEYHSLDWSPNKFGEIVAKLGGVEKVYDLYFETLLKSIKADLGVYKPKRIGHPTLVKIYQLRYPLTYQHRELIEEIVKEIKKRHYQIDLNTAGIRKPLCKVPYPSGYFMELVKSYNVERVYGSDAHTADDVGRDFGRI